MNLINRLLKLKIQEMELTELLQRRLKIALNVLILINRQHKPIQLIPIQSKLYFQYSLNAYGIIQLHSSSQSQNLLGKLAMLNLNELFLGNFQSRNFWGIFKRQSESLKRWRTIGQATSKKLHRCFKDKDKNYITSQQTPFKQE